ncbi:glycosyl transferase, partial [Campylobacter coli]|nr:glycosyl transferase [Campylobacter coli]
MLGEVLIKADVNKFKDGYFFLFKNIEQTKKDYKIIKEILDLSKKFEENIYTILAENKNLFMCNLDNLKIILDLHKNYIPVLKVIFQNFNYTLNHLEMIQEWLLSSDFKQRFQDVNHPYPSLLDPKKLNDQAEKINYHNISGELAWKMNLPLPENYKLIWLWAACSGTMAIY